MEPYQFKNKQDLLIEIAELRGKLEFKEQELKRTNNNLSLLKNQVTNTSYLINALETFKNKLRFELHGEDLLSLLMHSCDMSYEKSDVKEIDSFKKLVSEFEYIGENISECVDEIVNGPNPESYYNQSTFFQNGKLEIY